MPMPNQRAMPFWHGFATDDSLWHDPGNPPKKGFIAALSAYTWASHHERFFPFQRMFLAI
jgi:hypothetical protein